MTKEAYYKRNWTPGPPPKQIIDHTHQPYSYQLKMWYESYKCTKRKGNHFFYVDTDGNEYLIPKYWYNILYEMNRNDYNMYHRWFRNEIHFLDEDKVWTMFKLPENQTDTLRRKQQLIKPFLSDLTAKQLATYQDLCLGLKQVEIAKKRKVSKNAVTNVKRALIKKLQKDLLQNEIIGGI
ncbi:MAG: hypothetical protein ACI4TY_00520 [Candidatus Limosilactobacillus intestinavium]